MSNSIGNRITAFLDKTGIHQSNGSTNGTHTLSGLMSNNHPSLIEGMKISGATTMGASALGSLTGTITNNVMLTSGFTAVTSAANIGTNLVSLFKMSKNLYQDGKNYHELKKLHQSNNEQGSIDKKNEIKKGKYENVSVQKALKLEKMALVKSIIKILTIMIQLAISIFVLVKMILKLLAAAKK